MIRIDEIYEHTFLPWVKKNLPTTSIFYCDPFGRSDPDSILCRGLEDADQEENSIFFFDQEPVQLSIHIPTFDRFVMNTYRPKGLFNSNNPKTNPVKRFLVTSETNSDNVDYICKRFELQPFYYFFHGWAALDWYRGYDRTFLIKPVKQREIKKTFFSPNRIIGGERKHRVLLLYKMALCGLLHNNISAPSVCPVENQSIQDIGKYFLPLYNTPDNSITKILASMDLPMLFPGEDTQRMSSCWLDQIDLSTECLLYHVTETVYFGRRNHLTEKAFKPIALGMPFVLSGPAHSLSYLRSYGFKTFDQIWNEEYDTIENDHDRIQYTATLLTNLDRLTMREKQQIFEKCIPIIEHNWNHFYNGDFEKILWQELNTMLSNLSVQCDLHRY
jgi:hypothetical protein